MLSVLKSNQQIDETRGDSGEDLEEDYYYYQRFVHLCSFPVANALILNTSPTTHLILAETLGVFPFVVSTVPVRGAASYIR